MISQDGWTRTSDLVRPRHAEYQAFPRPETQCAQPESNRHTLHGKQEGCHYIMGAKNNANQVVKERQRERRVEHRVGLEPT